MNTPFERRESGLVTPLHAREPEPPRGPLELRHDREEATQCFTQLLNLPEVRGACMATSRGPELRSKMIRHLAEVLLGDDFACEILT